MADRIATCRDDARFDHVRQAEYVAGKLHEEFETVWRVVPCENHFHVHEACTNCNGSGMDRTWHEGAPCAEVHQCGYCGGEGARNG